MARVTLLGRLADTAGWRERTVHADTIGLLRLAFAANTPELARVLDAVTVVVIVNNVVTRGDARIGPDDEVGFMPPMSGG